MCLVVLELSSEAAIVRSWEGAVEGDIVGLTLGLHLRKAGPCR